MEETVASFLRKTHCFIRKKATFVSRLMYGNESFTIKTQKNPSNTIKMIFLMIFKFNFLFFHKIKQKTDEKNHNLLFDVVFGGCM